MYDSISCCVGISAFSSELCGFFGDNFLRIVPKDSDIVHSKGLEHSSGEDHAKPSSSRLCFSAFRRSSGARVSFDDAVTLADAYAESTLMSYVVFVGGKKMSGRSDGVLLR